MAPPMKTRVLPWVVLCIVVAVMLYAMSDGDGNKKGELPGPPKPIPVYDAEAAQRQVAQLFDLYNRSFEVNFRYHFKSFEYEAGADPYLAKLKRQERLRQQCFPLDLIRRTSVGHISDCGNLLPIVEAYVDEVDTVVEAGSRHGITSEVALNRYPLRMSSMDITIHRPLHAMHKYFRDCQVGTEDAGISRIDEGDDIKVGMPYETQYLFLDTLHNADQLYKELEDFHDSSTQWITFHDSHSWSKNNEASSLKRSDVPAAVSQWKGLASAIHHFLNKYKTEWVEEMNNIHSHGFLVVRRRSFKQQILPVTKERKAWMLAGSTTWNIDTVPGVLDLFHRYHHVVENLCTRAYRVMAPGSNPGALCPDGFLGGKSELPVFPELGAGMNYYSFFAVMQDRIPMFSRLGYFHSFGIPSKTECSFVMGGALSAAERAVEVAALLAAWSSKSREKKPLFVVQPTADAQNVVNMIQNSFAHDPSFVGYLKAYAGKQASNSDVVFVLAATLREHTATENFGSQGRIVVYGTGVWAAEQYTPEGFELTVAINGAMGLAMYQKVGYTAQNYHKFDGEGPAPVAAPAPKKPAYKGNPIDYDMPLHAGVSMPGQAHPTGDGDQNADGGLKKL